MSAGLCPAPTGLVWVVVVVLTGVVPASAGLLLRCLDVVRAAVRRREHGGPPALLTERRLEPSAASR